MCDIGSVFLYAKLLYGSIYLIKIIYNIKDKTDISISVLCILGIFRKKYAVLAIIIKNKARSK